MRFKISDIDRIIQILQDKKRELKDNKSTWFELTDKGIVEDNWNYPEKWCIKWGNKNQFDIIRSYFKDNNLEFTWNHSRPELHNEAYSTNDNRYIGADEKRLNQFLKDGYQLITFEEFEKYIINKK